MSWKLPSFAIALSIWLLVGGWCYGLVTCGPNCKVIYYYAVWSGSQWDSFGFLNAANNHDGTAFTQSAQFQVSGNSGKFPTVPQSATLTKIACSSTQLCQNMQTSFNYEVLVQKDGNNNPICVNNALGTVTQQLCTAS